MEPVKKPLRRSDKKVPGTVAGFNPDDLEKALKEFKELQKTLTKEK